MKKMLVNKEKSNIKFKYTCDSCGSLVEGLNKLFWLDTEYNFCNWKCLKKFVDLEVKKSNKLDNRFEYGRGK